MEGANGSTNWTLGCAKNLPMHIRGVTFKVHAHVIEHTPFRLLLGCPFQHQVLCTLDLLPNGSLDVFIRNPSDISQRILVPSQPHIAQVASIRVLSYHMRPTFPSPSNLTLAYQPSVISAPISHHHKATLAYKKVANKVCPVPASLPEDFHNVRCFPEDPLLTLPSLPTSPPDFVPGLRLTEEHLAALDLNGSDFLWPEELKLLQHILLLNKSGLAWTEDEKGRFRDNYFAPVKIPAIEHIPWIHKNIPIPYGILDNVIQIFKDKLAAGIYKPSDTSYCSCFFCVKKKNGSLRLVHDLQPLNAVTICNSGVPPLTDQIIESMAGCVCYAMLDLFVGYDHQTLDVALCNLTTVQSPVGAVRLTCLPQGWTNVVAIFHDDITFILTPEIPSIAHLFVDDCAIKGLPSRYETDDGGYETIPENPGIHRFIWEHSQDIHRILHRLRTAGATVSAKKIVVASPKITILGHKCTYEGHIPDDSKIACICDWPSCKSLSNICAFLGLTGFMRVWIHNYSAIACPLVNLTHKGTLFTWQDEHESTMQALKDTITTSPALISIDYSSDLAVYLSIDLSWHGVGWIVTQDCADGCRHPAHFGSIAWNEHKTHYSQAKLKLYSLFRALCALCLHIIGIKNLIVEMDAQYICSMLKNPDIQPNATINRWIAAILLFDFNLVHMPAAKHHRPNGLSRREPADDKSEDDDPKEWIDNALSLGLWVVSWTQAHHADREPAVWTLSISIPSTTAATIDNNNNNNHTIPTNKKVCKAEEQVEGIRHYLTTLRLPNHLDNAACNHLLKRAKHFFIADDRLWRQQEQG